MSWAILIYMIDVLSTDGQYDGFAAIFGISLVVYFGLTIFSSVAGNYGFFMGQEVYLTQNWNGFKTGDKLIIKRVDGDGTISFTMPDGSASGWWKQKTIASVTGQAQLAADSLSKPRKVVAWMMVFGMLGIGYAKFMPSQETAYKMLAAYVGQTVVTSPAVQETAGNAIDYLNKAIKKYSDELDTKAEAEKAPAKEGAK